MNKEIKELIKKECDNMPKEQLKKLCEMLFKIGFVPNIKEHEQIFRYMNSLWCVCDSVFVNKYDEEY